VTQAPADVFGLTELIEGFTFRNQGGIKILKKWRELAVIMQIDVEIVSVARNQFVNYQSVPASGFYGYATLVFRDFCLPSIPITQSRQTVYYAVNEFAQSAWMEFHQMVRLQENFKGVETLVCFNTGLLGGACVAKECKPIPQPSFVEFPLREVFFKVDTGTQFKVELSYWKINDVLDNCGNLIAPKSNQNDADKDKGLPPNGTKPQEAKNPNNPFGGLPPVSPSDREGIIPDVRLNGLDSPNSDNAPIEGEVKRWAFVQGQYKDFAQNCLTLYFGVTFEISLEDDSLTPYVSPPFPIPDSCGGQLLVAELRGSDTGTVYTSLGGDGTYVTEITDAVENPYTGYNPTPNKP